MEPRKLRLLIVDDLEIWRFALKEMFTNREDVQIVEAGSGEEAVAKVKAEDYDLVLLDMRMPSGIEGLDALVEIKRVKSQTQVIIVSAYGDIPKAVEAMKRGAFDFLPKEEDLKEQIVFRVEEFIRRTELIADRERLIQAKYEEAGRAKSKHKKGKALEDLIAALFASVEGFSVIDRNVNTATEEIDLVIRNHCTLGFLIYTERFAETFHQESLRDSWLKRKIARWFCGSWSSGQSCGSRKECAGLRMQTVFAKGVGHNVRCSLRTSRGGRAGALAGRSQDGDGRNRDAGIDAA
jgi:DNA-binding NarL/FixJ family response regulator